MPIPVTMGPLPSELLLFPTMLSWTPDHRKLFHTPPGRAEVTFHSDLWVADSSCTTNCDGIDTFNPSQSTSYTNLSTPFAITYGSGNAQGALGKDKVQLSGFSVPDQVFGKSLFPPCPGDAPENSNSSSCLRRRLKRSPRCPGIRLDGSCMAVYRRVGRSALLADPRFLWRMGRTSDGLPDHSLHQHLPGQDP